MSRVRQSIPMPFINNVIDSLVSLIHLNRKWNATNGKNQVRTAVKTLNSFRMSVVSIQSLILKHTHAQINMALQFVSLALHAVDVNFTLKWNSLSELIRFLRFRFCIIRSSLHFIRMINLLKWECKSKSQQIVTSVIECQIRPKKIQRRMRYCLFHAMWWAQFVVAHHVSL